MRFQYLRKNIHSEREDTESQNQRKCSSKRPFLLADSEFLVVGLLCFIAFFGSIKYLDILPETSGLLSIPFFFKVSEMPFSKALRHYSEITPTVCADSHVVSAPLLTRSVFIYF